MNLLVVSERKVSCPSLSVNTVMRRNAALPSLSLALLATLGAIVTGCRSGESSPERHALVDSRDWYDPRSLDPAHATDVPTGRAVAYLFDGLTRFTPDARIEPGLARSWDVSPDGLRYTFHLRSDVKFHDGKPFVSRHVAQSWRRVLDPATKAGSVWPLYPLKGARAYAEAATDRTRAPLGIETPDDTTV